MQVGGAEKRETVNHTAKVVAWVISVMSASKPCNN